MSSAAPTETPLSPISPAELSRIAQDLQIRKVQLENVVQLLDEGNTIPFITRYRKERTGGLDEEVLRVIQERIRSIRVLNDRKQTILRSIELQGRLTDELKAAVLAAESPRRLEDLYLPFKPKKKSLAAEAREKGLEPFALAVWSNDPAVASFAEVLPTLLNPEKGVNTIEEVLQGAQHVIAELIAETADLRASVRRMLWDTAGLVVSKNEKLPEGKGLEYKDYFQFAEAIGRVPPHRILAINRGERENALSVKIDYDAEALRNTVANVFPQLAEHPHREFLATCVEDGLSRLLMPSLEREIRRELTEFALQHAISVFARNLRGLLMQPPLRNRRILAVDPGFRTGCKLVVLDESGVPLEDTVVFPHAPQKKLNDARKSIERLIRQHQVTVIAIGNGTACRETEEIIAGLIAEFDARRRGEPPPTPTTDHAPVPISASDPPSVAPAPVDVQPAAPADSIPNAEPDPTTPTSVEEIPSLAESEAAVEKLPAEPTPVVVSDAEPTPTAEPEPDYPEPPAELAYVIVNEAGASDYSASPVGREEFPSLDATLRGTISIGRRLQDPLSELVKIDPQHVGVGLYQHDVHGKHLKGSLEAVIESCVNQVGVELNCASVPLLRHVAGLNQLVARELFDYRQQHGRFSKREQLTQVPSIGPMRFTQAAGFLKIPDGDEPLDATWIHPESYDLTRQILSDLGHSPEDLRDRSRLEALRESFNNANVDEIAQKHDVNVPAVIDIFDALARPGRDPREDLPPPVFRRDVLKLEDLQPAMELKGTVLNVVDFGAFVDIGLKDSGLVHISQLANRFIRNPHDVVTVGDVVTVWVMTVDNERRRVSLTMIPPGTERKQPERRPQERQRRPQEPRGERPPRQEPRSDQAPGEPRPPRRGKQQRRGGQRRPETAPTESQVAVAEAAPPAPARQRHDRKPVKAKPLPKLTQEKREGKAYLNTLGELEAFYKAREGSGGESPPPPAQ